MGPMPKRIQARPIVSGLCIFVAITTGFALYETLKERFLPSLSKWQSHQLSIAMVAALSAIGLSWISLQTRRHLRQIRQFADALQEQERHRRENEARYRLLFEANPLPMWVYDRETLSFFDVNDTAVAHYGYSRDEFMAMTIKDLQVAEDLPDLL